MPPRRAMYLLGHTDPKLTLAVYQQVLDLGRGTGAMFEQALGCTLVEARAVYNGGVLQTNHKPSTKNASSAGDAREGEG